MARVLHIHVTGPQVTTGSDSVTVGCNILVGIDGSPNTEITDSYAPDIALKGLLGIYKTSIQINSDIAVAIVAFMLSSHSIPANGYAAIYVSGAYGVLNIL